MSYMCGNLESPRGSQISHATGNATFGWLPLAVVVWKLECLFNRLNAFVELSRFFREKMLDLPYVSIHLMNLKMPGLKWVTSSIMSIMRALRDHMTAWPWPMLLPSQPWIFSLSMSFHVYNLHRLNLRARYAEKSIGCLQASLSWLQNFGTISKNAPLKDFLRCKDTGECEDWEKIEGGFQKRWSNWTCCCIIPRDSHQTEESYSKVWRQERENRFGKRKGTLRALMFFRIERCHVLIFLPFSASMKFLSLMVCVEWIPVRHWWNFLSSKH